MSTSNETATRTTENSPIVNTVKEFLTKKKENGYFIPAGITHSRKEGEEILGITPSCFYVDASRLADPSLTVGSIFMSFASANFSSDEDKISISINTTADAKAYQNIFQQGIYYDYTMGTTGAPKINVYICFVTPSIGAPKGIITRSFDITFQQNNIQSPSIDLSTIETVEVFLIQDNPRTSRGTVTTVTQPTNGS